MFKLIICLLLPICLFSNDFIWEKTEIGDDFVNTGQVQLGANDSLGNVVFFDKELKTLFFKNANDTTWQIKHKNEINSEISEVLSVFISRGNIYFLVLYNDLTQSLVSTEIKNDLLSDNYTKYESFEFYSDSIIKLNKMVRLNDEILISYSNKVNMTDYFILHNFEKNNYISVNLNQDKSGDRELIENNKIIDVFFFKSRFQAIEAKYDLVFLTKNTTQNFYLKDYIDFDNYGYVTFSNGRGLHFELESMNIDREYRFLKPMSYYINDYKLEDYYINYITDSIFTYDLDYVYTNDYTFVAKSINNLYDSKEYDKLTLIIEDKGEVLTDFIKFKNTIFFLFYNEVDDLVYTYFSNDECDTWNYFISSSIDYNGEFEYCVGKDEVYLYNDKSIYSTNYNYYFSSVEKFSNINHFYNGNTVKIFSNFDIDEIKIFDLNGKEVYTNFNVNSKTQEINLDEVGHTVGVYLCLVKTKNEVKVLKLIKGVK